MAIPLGSLATNLAGIGTGVGGIGYGLSALGSLGSSLFGGGRPSIPTIQPRKPSKLEQASKYGMIYGPGDQYNLGLMDASRPSIPGFFGFNPSNYGGGQQTQSNNFNFPSTSFTGQMPSGINPNLMFRTTLPQSNINDKGYNNVINFQNPISGNQGQTLEGMIMGGGFGAHPSGKDINAAADAMGLSALEIPQTLQGQGTEAFSSGLLSAFQNLGKASGAVDLSQFLAGNLQNNNAAQVGNLQNFLSQDAAQRDALLSNLYGQSNQYVGQANPFIDQAGGIANRMGSEAFVNANLGRNITSEALGDKAYLRNLLESRFGQTDQYLGNAQGGNINPQVASLIDDIFGQNVNLGQRALTTGPVADEFNSRILEAQNAAERRGLSKASSAYTDAVRKIESDRQNREYDMLLQQQAQRSGSLLDQINRMRETNLSSAQIANQGATSFAGLLPQLLEAGTQGLNASTNALNTAGGAGDLLSKLASNKLAQAELSANTADSQFKNTLANSQFNAGGIESVIDRMLKGDSTALDAVLSGGQLANQTSDVGSKLAALGLTGQEQGFNELMSLFNLAKGNRQDRQKLDVINAYGSVGVPVGVG